MDRWDVIWTGVVIGLTVAAVVASADWYVKRRARKAKKAEARSEARIHLRAGADQVAQELRANAGVAKRFEVGHRAPSEGKAVSLVQWRNFKGQIAGLQAEAPELWHELEETYEALEETKAEGVFPPPPADLLRLADRLVKAAT